MRNSSDKLKRLVEAQTVLENLAKGEVGELANELTQLEYRLEEAQKAFSSTNVTLMFSDFYIGHLHMLQTRCIEVRQLLETAQTKLQFEAIRSRKLKLSQQSAAEKEMLEREAKDNLERLERSLFRS